MYGIENCIVCGATHNMGSIEFQNLENGRICQVHFNGLHALAHGSFAYHGTSWPNQRISALELYRTMKTHHLPVQNDSDNDGLTDAEESHFGYNPVQSDTDGDGITDGMELAMTMKTILDSLPTSPGMVGPYVTHHPTYGFWSCLLCGMPVNMGYLEIWNPNINGPFTMSYYAYHFLGKGSFSYEGRIQNGQWMFGRLDPIMLAAFLDFSVHIETNHEENIELFNLYQNYPNPFNQQTIIRYKLKEPIFIELNIYELLGKKVKTIAGGHHKAGEYRVLWDGLNDNRENLASGIYLCSLIARHEGSLSEVYTQTRKIMLLK